MNSIEHLKLLAEYNQWMNQKLYTSASQLSEEQLKADQGAFFGSLFGTLNHLAVADTIWLKRIAYHPACATLLSELTNIPAPNRLDTLFYTDLRALQEYRVWLDRLIIRFVDDLPVEVLNDEMSYANMKGIQSTRNLYALLTHVFNHQTHHRGQATTLLYQMGIDPGSTDLLNLIPDTQPD
ncbi:DinB family protein [Ectopseudomonas mendocina]|uniref:DinB family protein n=1 Tax=Ectopseudomonas mendocina TaxID=300 RepID=A0ABZ2RHR1_ECTME